MMAQPWKKRAPGAITLPERMQCVSCKKSKTLPYFSDKQRDIAIASVRKSGTATAKCTTCVQLSANKHEMKCVQCDQVLSKDDFSRRQRMNPDEAVCKLCMEVHLMQNAPVDDMKAQREAEARKQEDEKDFIDADDYSEMQTNAYDTSSNMSEAVFLPGMSGNQGFGQLSQNSTIRSDFSSMFDFKPHGQSQSIGTESRATTMKKNHYDNYDDDKDDEIEFVARRVPAGRSQATTFVKDGDTETDISSKAFRPMDPISNPSGYRGGRALAPAIRNVPKPPIQPTYKADYNSTHHNSTSKFRDIADDEDSDPENY